MIDESRKRGEPDSGFTVHGGHRIRLRKRAREDGLAGFEAHEVMELLLFYAIPRRNVNMLAHRLIERFGSVDGALRASEGELSAVEGVGVATARWLCQVGEALRAYEALTPADRPLLSNYRQVCDYVGSQMRPSPEEGQQTWLILLSGHGRLIESVMLCDSLSWGEPMILREALERILDTQAEGILLVELVPDRPPVPEEYETTRLEQLCATLKAVEVRLWDLLLVGEKEIHSMLKKGDFDRSRVLNEYTRQLRETYLGDQDYT